MSRICKSDETSYGVVTWLLVDGLTVCSGYYNMPAPRNSKQ